MERMDRRKLKKLTRKKLVYWNRMPASIVPLYDSDGFLSDVVLSCNFPNEFTLSKFKEFGYELYDENRNLIIKCVDNKIIRGGIGFRYEPTVTSSITIKSYITFKNLKDATKFKLTV